MEIKSDIEFKGEDWAAINHKLKGVFFDDLWEAFKLTVSIGILYDSQLDEAGEVLENKAVATIPRTMTSRFSEEISYYFKTAILTSKCINLSEKDRLYLAFSEDVTEEELEDNDEELLKKDVSDEALNFNKVNFLKGFSNFGATKIASCITNNESETMENLMEFLNDSYEGNAEELLRLKKIEYIDE